MSRSDCRTWLLLLPQLPPQPSSLRVRVWRRLQQIGAVAVKNAAYALPDTEAALEDFTWLRQEIVDSGGGALLLRADGWGEGDEEIQAVFQRERDQDYGRLAEEAGRVESEFREEKDLAPETLINGERTVRQFRERLERIREIDFFAAPASAAAVAAVEQAERAMRARTRSQNEAALPTAGGEFSGRIWVTRVGVYVDRAACAWMIRRFIDPAARFAFVRSEEPLPSKAIPYDMAGVEFGHHGARCSAEILAGRFLPDDSALGAVAEVVHDLDLKDEGFGRAEAAGLKRLLDGICALTADDADRIRQAGPLFEALYAGFRSAP